MFNSIFPKIHKEGYKFLAISILITFIVLFFSKFLGFILILISVWVYYFFRDPERFSINDESYLVSPADGLITDISEKSGPEELRLENTKEGQNVWQIADEFGLPGVKSARMSQIYKKLESSKPAYTVTGSGGGGTHVYHYRENRALTNRERARLQREISGHHRHYERCKIPESR